MKKRRGASFSEFTEDKLSYTVGSCGSSACFFTCWKKNDIAMTCEGITNENF